MAVQFLHQLAQKSTSTGFPVTARRFQGGAEFLDAVTSGGENHPMLVET